MRTIRTHTHNKGGGIFLGEPHGVYAIWPPSSSLQPDKGGDEVDRGKYRMIRGGEKKGLEKG